MTNNNNDNNGKITSTWEYWNQTPSNKLRGKKKERKEYLTSTRNQALLQKSHQSNELKARTPLKTFWTIFKIELRETGPRTLGIVQEIKSLQYEQKIYAQPGFRSEEWDAQSSLGFSNTNRSLNPSQNTRPCDSQQQKKWEPTE